MRAQWCEFEWEFCFVLVTPGLPGHCSFSLTQNALTGRLISSLVSVWFGVFFKFFVCTVFSINLFLAKAEILIKEYNEGNNISKEGELRDKIRDLQKPACWEKCEIETAKQNPEGARSKSSLWS